MRISMYTYVCIEFTFPREQISAATFLRINDNSWYIRIMYNYHYNLYVNQLKVENPVQSTTKVDIQYIIRNTS